MQAIEFDNQGRMKYHPSFHKRHGKTFTEKETEYMCKYWDADGAQSIAMALERTESTIRTKISRMKKKGSFGQYRDLNKYW